MTNTELAFVPAATPTSGGLVVWLGDIYGSDSATLLPTNDLPTNQALLDTLFGSGNTTLSGDWTAGLVIEFKGSYANSNIPPLSFDASALAVTLSATYTQATQPYFAGTYAAFQLTFTGGTTPPDNGYYTIDGVAQVSVSNFVGSTNWGAASTDTPDTTGLVLITATATGVNAAPSYDTSALLQTDGVTPWDGTVTPLFTPGTDAIPQQDTLDIFASGGTFVVHNSSNGSATPAEPFGVSAATLESDMQGTSGDFAYAPVTVAQTVATPSHTTYVITFAATYGPSTAGSVDGTSLTDNVSVTESVLQAGSSGGGGGSRGIKTGGGL